MTHIQKGQLKKNSREVYVFLPQHYCQLPNKEAWDTEIAQSMNSKYGYTNIYPTLNGMNNYPETGTGSSQQGFLHKKGYI